MMPSRLKSRSLDPQRLDRAGREGGHVTEMQRRRLLLAFTEVLAEVGLQDAGVGRVCARAGVSRRTFYDLFCDREACFLAVFDAAVERFSQSIVLIYARGGRWRERIRGALTVLLERLDEEPALAHVFSIETLKAGGAVMERRRRVLDALTAAVDEGRLESKRGAEPPPLTAQSMVGGAVSVIHARVLEGSQGGLIELLNPLMSMIVFPYLGPGAARRELDRPIPPKPARSDRNSEHPRDPFKDLPIRITFRTARVLTTIGDQPGTSNRQIADSAGVTDQGQMSKLLHRLQSHGLIQNHCHDQAKGEPNQWQLTPRGHAIQHAIGAPAAHAASPNGDV